jgi:hypothetical protein
MGAKSCSLTTRDPFLDGFSAEKTVKLALLHAFIQAAIEMRSIAPTHQGELALGVEQAVERGIAQLELRGACSSCPVAAR